MSRTFFCRKVRFRAAHHYAVPGLSKEENEAKFGESASPHDHDWSLTLWLEGPLDENGMIVDLMEVDALLKREVVDRFDGGHINEVDPFFQTHQPTNEVLVGYFAERLQPQLDVRIARLQVAEADDLFAEWTP